MPLTRRTSPSSASTASVRLPLHLHQDEFSSAWRRRAPVEVEVVPCACLPPSPLALALAPVASTTHPSAHILNVADDVPNFFENSREFHYLKLSVQDCGQDEGISRVFQAAFESAPSFPLLFPLLFLNSSIMSISFHLALPAFPPTADLGLVVLPPFPPRFPLPPPSAHLFPLHFFQNYDFSTFSLTIFHFLALLARPLFGEDFRFRSS